jgi:hypothetical protein
MPLIRVSTWRFITVTEGLNCLTHPVVQELGIGRIQASPCLGGKELDSLLGAWLQRKK